MEIRKCQQEEREGGRKSASRCPKSFPFEVPFHWHLPVFPSSRCVPRPPRRMPLAQGSFKGDYRKYGKYKKDIKFVQSSLSVSPSRCPFPMFRKPCSKMQKQSMFIGPPTSRSYYPLAFCPPIAACCPQIISGRRAAGNWEMEQAKSLAEFLGANEPGKNPETKALTAAQRRQSIREFSKGILQSQEYRDSIVRRIMFDALPPAVEQLLYYYAEGKPLERLAVEDNRDSRFEGLSSDDIEARAKHLMLLAQEHRKRERAAAEDEQQPAAVH